MMTFTRKIFAMMLMLVVSTTAFAEVKTWSHVWDTSKANGGEGFYHISNNADTVQTTMLKNLSGPIAATLRLPLTWLLLVSILVLPKVL